MADVDPTLLALSDLLVLDALTRAWTRTVKRSDRQVHPAARHNQYLRNPVNQDRVVRVLNDAWVLCPLLVDRHGLQVDSDEWQQVLASYTETLLMMQVNHNPARLIPVLQRMAVDDRADTWEPRG